MKEKPTVIAVVNQKGGTAKTTTVENLGIGLAREGKKVLLVDTDPQGSLTISLGYPRPDELEITLFDLLNKTINEDSVTAGEGILHQAEGIDLIPANISLAGLEVALVNTMNRERILKQFLEPVKGNYDYVLLEALVPVQANYLSAKGLEQLLQTINKVKRQINPKLRIEGILLTMVDGRTNYGREISSLIRDTYGGHIKIFNSEIPRSVRAAEISAEGKSIFLHDPKGKVAEAYQNLTKEVMTNAEKRRKHQLEQLR